MFFPPSCFGFVASSWQKREESFWEVIQFYHDRRAISRKAIMQVRKGEIEKKGSNKLERRRRLRLHEAQEKAGRKLFFNVGAKTFFSPSLSSPPPLFRLLSIFCSNQRFPPIFQQWDSFLSFIVGPRRRRCLLFSPPSLQGGETV